MEYLEYDEIWVAGKFLLSISAVWNEYGLSEQRWMLLWFLAHILFVCWTGLAFS